MTLDFALWPDATFSLSFSSKEEAGSHRLAAL